MKHGSLLSRSSITAVLFLAACGAGADGRSGLVSVEPEPAGANCAGGGLAVRTGLDDDGDGVLDAAEVTATEYVCQGADGEDGQDGQDGAAGDDGRSTLMATSDEPPGDNCPEGGVEVSSGLDLDGDGVLDPEEVTATAYVCDGEAGGSSLVSVLPEPPGLNCPAGGQAIRSGLDTSGDGLLQPEEVTATAYVCDGAAGEASLVRQEDAPPESSCAFGGRLVLSGVDANGNGYLDDAEVTASSAVCNGAPGAPGHASLFSMRVELPGAACAAGGFRVEAGLDVDDDGLLDPTEVTQSRAVCHGAAGADGVSSLVATSAEPAGEHCGAGGTRIDSGLDLDGDGALDPGEVTATAYACHGADGSGGVSALVVTTDEPAGVHCTEGGVKVEVGLDDSGDGVLQASEVDDTRYVCDGGEVAVRVSNAAWGGVCARGGVKVETGLDDDGDGVLDDAEVDRTEYACNLFLAQIDPGAAHTCAVVSDGSARCWGSNGSGRLGDGTSTSRSTPVAVSGLAGAAEIRAGGSHTCARLTDGTVRCWGYNVAGQLGDGTTTSRVTPVTVSGLSGVAHLSAGSNHTCVVLSSGTVRCWGNNVAGQLGDGTTTNRSTAVEVSGLAGATDVGAGESHTCAVLTDGTVRCWGNNDSGQLGDGTTTDHLTPVTVSGLSMIAGVSAGQAFTCALVTYGAAKCWGRNNYGQLGDGTTTDRLTPVTVSGLAGTDAGEVWAGSIYACVRLLNGTAECWGSNNYGQLGDGTDTDHPAPAPVAGLPGVAQLATANGHACAVITDGTARCWGDNNDGQLGDGSTENRWVPVAVATTVAP